MSGFCHAGNHIQGYVLIKNTLSQLSHISSWGTIFLMFTLYYLLLNFHLFYWLNYVNNLKNQYFLTAQCHTESFVIVLYFLFICFFCFCFCDMLGLRPKVWNTSQTLSTLSLGSGILNSTAMQILPSVIFQCTMNNSDLVYNYLKINKHTFITTQIHWLSTLGRKI